MDIRVQTGVGEPKKSGSVMGKRRRKKRMTPNT